MRIRIMTQAVLCGSALDMHTTRIYRREMPDALSTRIQMIRRELGLNQTEFGKKLGVNQATVSRWESGSVPDIEALRRIADLGGMLLTQLTRGDVDGAATGPQLFVKGEVAAGVWREAFEWEHDDWKPYQGGSHFEAPTNARFGLLVRGSSMNEVYPEGTVLDCVSTLHADLRAYSSGQRVVVIRRRIGGEIEATVKEFRVVDNRAWLVPRSDHPEFQAPIALDSDDPEIEETVIVAVVKGSYRPE